MTKLIYSDTLPAGKHWSLLLRKTTRLRLTDLEGGGNVGMLFYNPQNTLERYNAPDTLKCQHTFKLTTGHCLYSDMGRIFCSIVADTAGWHDTVCGNTTKEIVAKKWGEKTYQTHRNDWQQNGHDSFLIEGAKYGLNRRDLASNINWFSKVTVDDGGELALDANGSFAGAAVELRCEMDTLVLFHTCPHPLSTQTAYPRKPILFELLEGAKANIDDPCRLSTAENGRGFENNRLYHAGCC
jgi:urea carboxylase-associated protein 2